MLAYLARVVFLCQDALAASDTGREVAATLAARGIELRDEGLAARLRAFELLLLSIGRRVTSEKLEGEILILFTLLRRHILKTFQLDESLGTVTPASIEHAGDDNHAVDLLG